MSTVLIGIPTNGDIKAMTTCSLVMATNLLRTAGHTMILTVREGPYTHWNREHLANDLKESDADALMFVDTDVMFPADGILRLLEHKKDIVGGMYHLKQDEPVTTIKLWNDDRTEFRSVADEPLPKDLFKVAALPTGFMMVRKSVFETMEFPYFRCDFGMGEDVSFCLRAQEAGIEVWCDPTIPIKHIGQKAY
jgi:GT2 family glycosyltransferase